MYERINAFLEDYIKLLTDMPAEVYEEHRQALILKKLRLGDNMEAQADKFWTVMDGV